MKEKEKKFPVIVLCGSTKFKKEFEAAAKELSYHGYIVLMPHVFVGDLGLKLTANEENKFKGMHKQRIDIADAIMVINLGGYIGESTKEEIEYAKSKGKRVYYRYIHCEDDCIFIPNCRAKNILPPFVMCDAYSPCPCYCEEYK